MARKIWFQRVVGISLLAASAYYIWYMAMAVMPQILTMSVNDTGLVMVALAPLVYAALLVALAKAWAAMAVPERKLSLHMVLAVYGRSVPAKYLPGSVLQYGSRQVLGAQLGLAGRPMALASLGEILLHVAISLVIAGGTMLFSKPLLGVSGSIALIICGMGMLWIGFSKIQFGYRLAIGWQTLFFSGFLFLAMLGAALVAPASSSWALAGLFMLAWVTGFVIPFVPGGIGVREVVIVSLGAPLAPVASLILFAALMRMVTLCGDVVLGIAAWCISPILQRNFTSP